MKIDKNQLKAEMLAMYETIIYDLSEELRAKKTLTDLDEGNTLDPEDFSNQTESREMTLLLEKQIEKTRFDLDRLQHIDFSEKSEAGIGALVTTDMFNFVLGVATTPFLFGNVQIVGVSPEAPIFRYLVGKKQGESFTYSGNMYNIHTIQ
jgi:hypothetical protein